jgi:hypothetical protein
MYAHYGGKPWLFLQASISSPKALPRIENPKPRVSYAADLLFASSGRKKSFWRRKQSPAAWSADSFGSESFLLIGKKCLCTALPRCGYFNGLGAGKRQFTRAG